ncbi:MAG: hypothetical protein ACKV19_20615 [Verrucomicrobiales bacterium]
MVRSDSSIASKPFPGQSVSLARRLGTTTHRSLLLHRLGRLGLETPEKLVALAESRGLRYYASTLAAPGTADGMPIRAVTDEELAIALLHPSLPWDPQRIRLAAAVLAGPGVRASVIARLAVMERSASVVREIALAGQAEEPDNSFWAALLALLPPTAPVPPGVLPHRSRYMAITGRSRPGTVPLRQWVRPLLD